MKIEIEVSNAVIVEAAEKAWKFAFQPPDYQKIGGEGFDVVKKEVERQISEIQFKDEMREYVRTAAATIAPLIARQLVTEELTKLVKKVVKEEKEANSLFTHTS